MAPSSSLRRALALAAASALSGCTCAPSRSDTASAPAPVAADLDALRKEMVREQIVGRGVSDPRVLAAMRRVPRHQFIPERLRGLAYADRPLPIEADQTISQPYIVALMTELGGPWPARKVLEVGTGSGYQAAVLSELCGDVFTIEIVPELARTARERLQRLGYRNVHVREGDGYRGWPEEAPFDAILVTAAPEEIPQPFLDQLGEGARLVIPVGPSGDQELVRLTRTDGGFRRDTVVPVAFVPMTGEVRDGAPPPPRR